MADVGRPSDLTEELTLEIRGRILEGKNHITIQKELNIDDSTWDRWVWLDYKDFRKKLNEWKRERMFKKAELVLEDSLMSENEKIKQDTAKFLAERIGKDFYSSKQELDNKGDLTIKIVNFGDNTSPQV